MKRTSLYVLIIGAILCSALPTAAQEEETTWTEKLAVKAGGAWYKARETYNRIYPEYIQDHLEIGTRGTHYTFTDDTQGEPFQGSFLGSLNEVHENQNYAPIKVFVQYKFTPYLGVGTGYDQFKAVTGSSPYGEEGGDGTFTLKGWYFYLLGSYPNKTRFTPFAEIGVVRYSSDFEEKAFWYDNGRRVINAESEVGSIFALGCDIEVYENWSVDLYFRHVNIDQDVDYVFMGYRHTPGTFTLSHNEFGLGVKYSF